MLVEKQALMAGVRWTSTSTVIINVLQLVQLFNIALAAKHLVTDLRQACGGGKTNVAGSNY